MALTIIDRWNLNTRPAMADIYRAALNLTDRVDVANELANDQHGTLIMSELARQVNEEAGEI